MVPADIEVLSRGEHPVLSWKPVTGWIVPVAVAAVILDTLTAQAAMHMTPTPRAILGLAIFSTAPVGLTYYLLSLVFNRTYLALTGATARITTRPFPLRHARCIPSSEITACRTPCCISTIVTPSTPW